MKKALWLVALGVAAAGVIHGGTLKLVAPSGGELCIGAGVKIEWTAVGIKTKLKLQLLKRGGALAGVIARNLDPAASQYNWTVGAPAVAGESYRVSVITADDAQASSSASLFLVKNCGNNNPPPPPGNLPEMKSQVELMQQPPTLTQPQVTPAPNTVVISRLPKAAISKFAPDRTSVPAGERIAIEIVAANVTQATLFDDCGGAQYDVSGLISGGAINRSWTAIPRCSGAWRLVAGNMSSKAEAKFDMQVYTIVKPEFVSYAPNVTQFNDGDRVSFTCHVRNARWVAVCDDWTGIQMDSVQTPAGQNESFAVLDIQPAHTVKVHLKAGNPGGETLTPAVLLQCAQDIPPLGEFLPERNAILGIPQDKATLKWKVRGAQDIKFYQRDPATSDTPANYTLFRSEVCSHFCERQFEHRPPRFPWIYRMVVVYYDGSQASDTRTVR